MEDNSVTASVIRQAAMLCVCNQTASIRLPALSIPMNPPADNHIPFVLQRSPGALLSNNQLLNLWKLRGEAMRLLFSQIIDFHLCRHDDCWAICAVVIAK